MTGLLARWRAAVTATAAASLLALGLAAAPAGAITHGSLDGSDHPMVGLMTAHAATGEYLWRCSGTLISPVVFITAGHCTEPDDSQGFGPPAYAIVFFSDDLIEPDPTFTIETRSCDGVAGYPCGNANETAISGDIYLHPDYDPNAFYTHDLGVVILDEPYDPGAFATLPELGAYDNLHTGPRTRFTAVGFGLQRALGYGAAAFEVAERVRMVAYPWLVQIGTGYTGDYSMLLSNNAVSGGTCFGDSGGPNFYGDTLEIAAVTSFGESLTCGGTGGVYRLDTPDDLEWLAAQFGGLY